MDKLQESVARALGRLPGSFWRPDPADPRVYEEVIAKAIVKNERAYTISLLNITDPGPDEFRFVTSRDKSEIAAACADPFDRLLAALWVLGELE